MADVPAPQYPQLQPRPQVDPLETLVKFGHLQNLVNQNQLFQQTNAAQQRIGEIMQKSVGEDGKPDLAKAAVAMSIDPVASFLAPKYLNEVMLRDNTQKEGILKDIEIQKKKMENYGTVLGAYIPQLNDIANDQNLTPAQRDAKGRALTLSAMGDFIAAGQENKKAIMGDPSAPEGSPQRLGYLGMMPKDFNGIRQAFMQEAAKSETAIKNLTAILPAFAPVQAGGTTIFGRTNPLTGVFEQARNSDNSPTVVPHTPDANALNTQEEFVDELGNKRRGSAVTTRPMFDTSGRRINPNSGTPQGIVNPMANDLVPGGGDAGGPMPQARPRVTQAPITELGPEKAASLKKGGEDFASARAEANDLAEVSILASRRVAEMAKAAQEATPGGGGSFKMALAQVAQALGFDQNKVVDPLGNGSLKASQLIEKFATTNTTQLLRQDVGSGQRLAMQEFLAYLKANPNIDTDPRAMESLFNYTNKATETALKQQKFFEDFEKKVDAGEASMKNYGPALTEFKRSIGAVPTELVKIPTKKERAEGKKMSPEDLKRLFDDKLK